MTYNDDERMLDYAIYSPCARIELMDQQPFGRNVMVGSYDTMPIGTYGAVETLRETLRKKFRAAAGTCIDAKAVRMTEKIQSDVDWWDKFYCSSEALHKCGSYSEDKYQLLQVLNSALEQQKGYDLLCDQMSFKMVDSNRHPITFKAKIYVNNVSYTEPNVDSLISLLPTVPFQHGVKCSVRIYIVQAFDLAAMDSTGKADPYIHISCGSQRLNNRTEYQSQTLSPIFGKMFEIKVHLPEERNLIVKIKDWNRVLSDNLIGQTIIDLENRLLSLSRSRCGIPTLFERAGVNRWRDSELPFQILENICSRHNITLSLAPEEVIVDDVVFPIPKAADDDGVASELNLQQTCLDILNFIGLTKEHVETRSLYHPTQPRNKTGSVQLWVDIFPLSNADHSNIPHPVDISPRKPEWYQMRVVIWNAIMDPNHSGKQKGDDISPDLFVKGFMANIEGSEQSTDIHYSSFDGHANFNWRFVFDMQYLAAEKTIVINNTDNSLLGQEKVRREPVMVLQVWDNQKLMQNKYLGSVKVALNDTWGLRKQRYTNLNRLQPGVESVNMFKQQNARGWVPVFRNTVDKKTSVDCAVGQLEIQIEICTRTEANMRPTGRGRERPNNHPVLAVPKRPTATFLIFSRIYRTLRYVIWRHHKKEVAISSFITFLVGLIISFLQSLPSKVWEIIINLFKRCKYKEN